MPWREQIEMLVYDQIRREDEAVETVAGMPNLGRLGK